MFNNFWNIKIQNTKVLQNIEISSEKFYKIKTFNRINEYFDRNSIKDTASIINNIKVPKLSDILSQINWKEICKPVPIIFHGDLQPENIVIKKNKFILLDWREDFGGQLKYGDIYYDLGKLHHALIVTGKIIRENKFKVSISNNKIKYRFNKRKHLLNYLNLMEKFIKNKGYNIKRLRIMSSLIFLNIAPLHQFSLFRPSFLSW